MYISIHSIRSSSLLVPMLIAKDWTGEADSSMVLQQLQPSFRGLVGPPCVRRLKPQQQSPTNSTNTAIDAPTTTGQERIPQPRMPVLPPPERSAEATPPPPLPVPIPTPPPAALVEGLEVGCREGRKVGCLLGCLEGLLIGCVLGWLEGCLLGCLEGCREGRAMGCLLGCRLGRLCGTIDGCAVGVARGFPVGKEDGMQLGTLEGSGAEGCGVGLEVGREDGRE